MEYNNGIHRLFLHVCLQPHSLSSWHRTPPTNWSTIPLTSTSTLTYTILPTPEVCWMWWTNPPPSHDACITTTLGVWLFQPYQPIPLPTFLTLPLCYILCPSILWSMFLLQRWLPPPYCCRQYFCLFRYLFLCLWQGRRTHKRCRLLWIEKSIPGIYF